ncbi:MAG TPA: DUF1810 domain-containing protein [Candidatus Acidoferrum sp.]|nr:DUF1810 domain-containing protein [Candidatus Acidoferrum sp.]
MTDDPFDLQRFLTAQAPVYDTVLGELRAGRKRTHWMWFIFPQLRGLGHSPTAQLYGIASLDEARAYLAHPILGPRLAECAEIVAEADAKSSLRDMLGTPDDLKFCSSMTLFSIAANDEPNVFKRALVRWCAGPDERTLMLLNGDGGEWFRSR